MGKRYYLMALILLTSLIPFMQTKIFDVDFTIKKFKPKKGWYYINKMVLSPGTADITMTS